MKLIRPQYTKKLPKKPCPRKYFWTAPARRKAAEVGVPLTACARNCLEPDRPGLGQFGHVFLMGPLYHLPEEKERLRAAEAAQDHKNPARGLQKGENLI